MEAREGYELLTPVEAIRKKQDRVRASLEFIEKSLEVNGVLVTKEREAMLGLSFSELRRDLHSGVLKAVHVLQAFQAKAIVETKKTNCITEFIPQAEAWASERDKIPSGKRGILHGLPISIKENFDVKGMDTTLGLVKRLGKPAGKHAVMVEVMLSEGAVPFVKTNVPQLIWSMGCSNPIFGVTTNPYDTTRSPGGSSGGEAALITGGGSVLGVGTDMGGSVRIPATFCGNHSLKWTQKRVSREGCYGNFKAMIGIYNTSGCLGKDIDSLAVCLESLTTSDLLFRLDPNIPPVHWRPEMYNSTRKLRVGWFDDDDFFPVTPGNRRAIGLSRDIFQKLGHTTVPFDLPDASDLWDFGVDLLVSDGGSAFLKHWEGGEIVDESVQFNKKILAAPWWARRVLGAYMGLWSQRLAKLTTHDASQSSQLWAAVARRKEYVDKLLKKWSDSNIDVLLGPAFPTVAPHPKHHGNLMPACVYFTFYNIVDFPSGTMTVTKETEQDQRELDHYATQGDFSIECAKETCKGGVGLPLSVQIGGLPFQEETVLYAMKQLEVALRNK